MRSHTSPIPSPSLSRWSGLAMVGQLSLQSFIPSLSVSVSGLPQPHIPGCVLFGSLGHPSLQFAVPSPSESVSATPQPHTPGSVLLGSLGHESNPRHEVLTGFPSGAKLIQPMFSPQADPMKAPVA